MSHLALRLLGFLACAALACAAPNLDREIILTPHSGPAREDSEIVRWQEKARATTAGAETFERLGWAYVAKARRTLDAGFYKLAEKTADVMNAQFGSTAPAQRLRGHVLHNLHRFTVAEAIARDLVAKHESPAACALLSDVLMEEGRLGEAVAVLQRLTNLKPGAEAYTRIAHVRWLTGDLTGAIAAMELAARATSPEDAEAGAWILVRLSGFRLQAGEAGRALALADEARQHAADFAPALLARGRALVALGEIASAITALEQAAALNPLPEYQWWLADAYHSAGREADAAKVESALRARGASADPRTLALFLATRGEDAAQAVRLAREELAQRQDVLTHDALAWALARQGSVAAAEIAMSAALAEHTNDARLLLHAGEIARLAGRPEDARTYFAQARAAAATLTPSEAALLAQRAGELFPIVITTQP